MTDLFANLRFKKVNDFDSKKLADAILKGYESKLRGDKVVKKVSFAPSSLGWKSGRCFAAETEFVTDHGVKTLGEMVGQDVMVWTGLSGKGGNVFVGGAGWKPARVESFGEQELMKVTLTKNGVEREIFATPEHRWIVSTTKKSTSNERIRAAIVETAGLEPGHIIWPSGGVMSGSRPNLSPDGVRDGFVYGDGYCEKGRFGSARVTLFGDKDAAMLPYFDGYNISDPKPHVSGGNLTDNHVMSVSVGGLPKRSKRLPDLTESSSYLYGWLAGYFAADGNIHSGGSATITSHNRESIEAVRDVCEILRIGHGMIAENEVFKIDRYYTEYVISMTARDLDEKFFVMDHHREYFLELNSKPKHVSPRWSVKSVEKTDRFEEVFCVVQPETERFSLADGILTMNCPRRWVLAFQGEHTGKDTVTATSVAVMDQGQGAHSRIQEALGESGILIEEEKEITNVSPPIRGFVDAIVEIDGVEIPVEVKTTRDEAFVWRQTSMKPTQYHYYQLLTYMKILEYDVGAFVYENKNDNTLLVIPIEMNEENQAVIDEAFEWMRTVCKAYEDGEMPMRPWKQSSPNCQDCMFFKTCWEDVPEGEVKIKPMVVHKW